MKKIADFITKNSGIHYDELHANKNETIFFEGDMCDHVGLILKGNIEIVSYFSDGKEVIYNVLSKGEMFGNNLIFSSEPYYRGDVVAIEEAEIAYISKDELLKALTNNKELLEKYLMQQSDFSKSLNFKIKLLTIDNAKDRLIYYLTFYKNNVSYKSITKLAKELYLTRETLSRTIYKLSSEGIIKLNNKTITFNE